MNAVSPAAPAANRTAGRERLLMTLALLLVLLLVFAVGEVALRVISKVTTYAPKIEMPYYERHAYLGKTLKPFASYRTTRASLEVNSRGFRGPEFAVPKPDNVYRIFALGGSTTFGFFPSISSNDATYPAQLQQRLNQSLGSEKTVEVINAGVPGYSVRTSLINFAARLLYYQPDMILVYHNTNDLSRYGHEYELTQPLDKLADRRSGWTQMAQVLFGWSYLLSELHYSVVNRVLPLLLPARAATPEPAGEWQEDVRYGEAFQRDLENLVAMARAQGVEVVLITQSITVTAQTDFNNLTSAELAMQMGRPDPYHTAIPLTQRYHMFERYNRIVASVADAQQTLFVDANNVIPKTPQYHWDYCHFTDQGAALLASTVHDQLLPVLQHQFTHEGADAP